MRKKHLFLFYVFFLVCVNSITAQDFTVGTGTETNDNTTFPCPLPGGVEGSRAQYLFRASELQAAGITRGFITGLKVDVLDLNNCGYIRQYTIKMGTTTTTTLSATKWEPTPSVYYSSAGIVPNDGINEFPFVDKFFWDGTSNILIEICSNGGSSFFNNETANAKVGWTKNLGFNATHTYGANNISNFCSTATVTESGTATTRPNLTFTWLAAPPDCAGTPSAGNAITNNAFVCPKEVFHLSTDAAPGMGLTYQWQLSTDNATWTNIAAATKDTLNISLTSATYYRVMINCSISNLSAASASVKVTPNPPVSGTFVIDNSLVTPGPGQFTSFTDAINYIKCGINAPVIFNVKNTGTPYNEQVTIGNIFGTSVANTITFNGNGAALNFLSHDENHPAVLTLNGAKHVILDNLNIKALASSDNDYGFGVLFTNDADSNILRKSTITVNSVQTGYYYNAIVISGGPNPTAYGSYADGNEISDNTISGGYYGISLVGGTPDYNDYPAARNKIINNRVRDFYTYGIYLTNTSFALVENNDISRPNRTNTNYPLYGIQMSGTNIAASISKNKIHGLLDGDPNFKEQLYGIAFSYASGDVGIENVVSNNIIYDLKGLGTIYALANNGSNYANFYYNTVSLDDQGSSSMKPSYGFYNGSQITAVEVKNNIFSISRGGTGVKYGIYLGDPNSSLLDIDFNDYFTNSHPTIKLGYYNNNTYSTLADWQNASKLDAKSFAIDPAFKDAANGDFMPTSAAFLDKGTPVAITNDIAGVTRSTSKPDVGAYEYSLPGCTTSFAAGDAFSNVGTTTCSDKGVVLNLKNNNVGVGMTYQWQTAASVAGTWTNLSTPLVAPPYSFTSGSTTLYYRAAVACNGGTPLYTTPIQINIGGNFPAGTYTIDKTKPTDPAGTKNFNSFKDAVTAISCGIAGPVVFNVKANTYTEQVKIASILNASAVNTITFQSENGNAATTILTNNAQTVGTNYTVKLDSASYIAFKNITVTATGDTYSRVFDIANFASHDSIVGCIINSTLPEPVNYATYGADQTTTAGIFAGTNLLGGNFVIKGNTFHQGSKGIYIAGASDNSVWPTVVNYSADNVIDGNKFDGVYHQSIYVANTTNVKIVNNTVPVNSAYSVAFSNQGTYGIYMNNCDSAIQVVGNKITLSDNTGYIYGIYMTGNDASAAKRGKIMNNKIVGVDNLTSMVNGIYNASATYLDVINNEVAVASSIDGMTNWEYASALVSIDARNTNYYNNSLLSTATGTGMYNATLWVDHQYAQGGGFTNFYNNIIANKGGGPAVFYNYTAEHIKTDYNLLYSSGSTLVKVGPEGGSFEKDYADIASWRTRFIQDINSITYDPAFTSATNLQPLATDAGSWALQGRGIQIAGNNVDINGNPRSVTLTDGVPDLGAYEFFPSVAPPDLVATPAVPAAGTTQVFSMGSDTVTKITWAPGVAVPTAITLKRYSGVLPLGLAATEKSLYYYVDADVTGSGPYKYNMQQMFIDPWLRTLPVKSLIKIGQTDASNKWAASATSTIDSLSNIISDTALTILDKFTGMTDGKMPKPPVFVTTPDSLNRGTRFWAPYAMHREALSGNGQQFQFMLAADVATDVRVSVNGTTYSKTYSLTAGQIITTDEIPKSGLNDARLLEEGLSGRGILIESNHPIAASAVVGKMNALLMPTGSYSKDYTTLGVRQFSGYPDPAMGTSWVNVIADNDNTVVQITPSGATQGGKTAGVPFKVTLNRGQVYQILGAFIKMHPAAETGSYDDSYESYDLTGTQVVSIPNSDGKCLPIAVFTGSGGTGIQCADNQNGADEYFFQQSYPMQAWGKKFLTAPLATKNSKNEMLFNQFRVLIKDPATVVKRNGVVMTGIKPGNFYEFTTRDPQYIEANKPIMISQCMTYFYSCGNDEYDDPGSTENMTYLTPVGLGVNDVEFYRKAGAVNYITAIVPNGAVSSLKIDGSSTFDTTYVHPQNAGYTVVMKKWADADGISVIKCDSNFTALVHEPNNNEGFVYNVGFQIPRIDVRSFIDNKYSSTGKHNLYTCPNTKFKPSLYVPLVVRTLTWKLSAVPGLGSLADVTLNNPVPTDTVEINSQDYYVYTLDQELSFAQTGTDSIPVSVTYISTNPLSCDQTVTGNVVVVVNQGPKADYTVAYDNCIFSDAQFTATGTVYNGAAFDRWNWNFGDNTTANIQNPAKKWNRTGSYNVSLLSIANDGCLDSTSQKIVVNSCDNIFIPNSFTPNGDGHNDQLKVFGSNIKEMKMMIFNQWGQKIFETTNMNNGWDGTLGGKPQPSGVYMFVCRITLNSGEIIDKKGSINLVR